MKSKSLLFLLLILTLRFYSFSQADISKMGFNYSALVRDTAGRVQPLKQVKIRFTLLMGQNGSSASSPYIETYNTKTDAYGFVNLSIGSGTKTGGTASDFASVDFAASAYWLLIEVYNDFSGTYEALAKESLNAVPYAKVAGSIAGSTAIPAGTIVAFGGDSAHVPPGWLLCDGRELDNSSPAYTALFKAIQYNWGSSDHSTHFNLPNTMGMFLRGVSSSSGNDPDTDARTQLTAGANGGNNVGSYQGDEFRSHNHRIAGPATTGNIIGSDINFYNEYVRRQTPIYSDNTGGNETRPKNVYVNYIIKL